MASLPSASVSISADAGALAGGTGYCVVIAPVGTNADTTPRVFSSARGILAQHDYAPGVDYSALHIDATKKPVIFVGVPIATAGAVGQVDASAVTGTSVITVTGSPLDELDVAVTVTTGGTIGTTGIKFTLSLDDGFNEKTINLGTASTYTVPYFGITLHFAAGTLIAGDEFTFVTSAPMYDSAGLAAARLALAAQLKLARSWMVIGDISTAVQAGYITTAINAYETSNERFSYARTSVKDRLPLAKKSKVVGQTLTFAEVGVTGDTITRSAGSWIDDGYKVGTVFDIAGSVSNDQTGAIVGAVTATVLTLTTADLVAEVATASVDVTMTATQTVSAWMSAADTAFASVDAQKRIDISAGRARKQSPVTGWSLRRPAAWAASIREYQHDLHTTVWNKEDGPVDGWSLLDAEDNVVEFDERVDGGALAARFTCFRTWSGGPSGAFLAHSLTRETEGSLLSYTHNLAVANLGCTVVQSATENIVGKTLQLKADGTATTAQLGILEASVNSALRQALLKEFVPGEGPRASYARWTASTDDDLSVVDATLTGVLDLRLNGTIVHVNTVVRVS